jgi:hypothetical protein
MDVLQLLLNRYCVCGRLVFLGDFNARCGALDNRTHAAVDELVELLGVDSELQRQHRAALPPRQSADQVSNGRGAVGVSRVLVSYLLRIFTLQPYFPAGTHNIISLSLENTSTDES